MVSYLIERLQYQRLPQINRLLSTVNVTISTGAQQLRRYLRSEA
jgi:hypothetical protein